VFDVGSDGSGEFVERGCDAPVGSGLDAKFVVTASEVLHERVTADDHASGLVAFEAAHRSKPGSQAAVVGFDPIVRVLLGVVKRARHELSITARSAGARSVTTSTGSP
jgi:hypothetical protein